MEFLYSKWLQFSSRFLFLSFADGENDSITISNALDYAIFKESGFNRVFVAISNDDKRDGNRARVDAPKKLPLPPVATPRAEVPYGWWRFSMPSSGSAWPMKENLHSNVICDGCEGEIFGFRYKCLDCFDFDLCMNCESQMMHIHHVMIRIADSRTFGMGQLKVYRKRLGRHLEDDYELADLAREEITTRRINTQRGDNMFSSMPLFIQGMDHFCQFVYVVEFA